MGTIHRISDIHPIDQPVERLNHAGVAALTAAELVHIVTGMSLDGATETIAAADGLAGLARMSVAELEALPGFGHDGVRGTGLDPRSAHDRGAGRCALVGTSQLT